MNNTHTQTDLMESFALGMASGFIGGLIGFFIVSGMETGEELTRLKIKRLRSLGKKKKKGR